MKSRTTITAALALIAMGAASGCTIQLGTGEGKARDAQDGDGGDDSSPADGAGGVADPGDGADECLCTPGAVVDCGCGAEGVGQQICQSDCRSFAACECAPALPATVTVLFVDALVAPFKTNGDPWDGLGASASPDDMAALAGELTGGDPYSTIAAFVLGLANAGYDTPDPFGFHEYIHGDESLDGDLATVDNNVEDTCHPIWPGPPGYVHVPLEQGIRFRLTVYDEDLWAHDPIGVAEINYDDVVAALESQQIYQVMVADQTDNQLLFVGISVTAE